MITITDSNYQDFINPTINGEVKFCASFPRREKYGALPFAREATIEPFSEQELKDRARELKDRKMRVSDQIRAALMAPLDQNGTNFCWANGPVNLVRVRRMVDGQPYVDLSPASVACPINGFRNEGGWGTEALKHIVQFGIVPSSMWPNNAINRQYYTAAAKAAALDYRVTEFEDLPPRDIRVMRTYLVLGIPVAIGLNWWSHEVIACDYNPEDDTDTIWNSWGMWSDGGFAKLTRSKSTPDDAVAARVPIAIAA